MSIHMLADAQSLVIKAASVLAEMNVIEARPYDRTFELWCVIGGQPVAKNRILITVLAHHTRAELPTPIKLPVGNYMLIPIDKIVT